MKLFEYEAKLILKQRGIPVPRSENATTPQQAEQAAQQIGGAVVIKSQILVSGRGKAGGIKFADDAAAAGKVAAELLGSTIKDCRVNSVLIEEKLDIVKQFYVSIAVDRLAKKYVVLASTSGGIDIEEIARTAPEKITRQWIDPTAGLQKADAEKMLSRLRSDEDTVKHFAAIITELYKTLLDYDAELIELNPLARTSAGEFIAADARLIIDDNAIFRHPEFKERSLARPDDTPMEKEARKLGFSYVDLDGNIGIIGNGAGLMMATVDLVQTMGGKPGNFLDVTGSGSNIKKGILFLMSKPENKAVFINIFGGITRCDVVAKAVTETLRESGANKAVVARLMGTNEEEGARILKEAGIECYRDLEEAVAAAVRTAAGVEQK
ncbi:MAG: ADP-forming succinate--CoA ligase subunit beta [Dehalococcoidales bacterium]|nr:ADP-forming succinate--CoA ligase subunit beta [Dehalococcoidales bacterium]